MPSVLFARDVYAGPKPSKKDLPYLLLAEHLVETEFQKAKQSASKDGNVFSVSGTSSSARTPLSEPIFLFAAGKVKPEQLALFRFEVKGGRREVVTQRNHNPDDDLKVFRLSLRLVDTQLYRVESATALDLGEYALCPEGTDSAFCFTVF